MKIDQPSPIWMWVGSSSTDKMDFVSPVSFRGVIRMHKKLERSGIKD